MELIKDIHTGTGWDIIETGINKEQVIERGTSFLLGNGYMGYRGTLPEWTREEYVACTVSDTYDRADGKWEELCTVPNGLYVTLEVGGETFSALQGTTHHYQRRLDLKKGLLQRQQVWENSQGQKVEVHTETFVSYDSLHLICMRYSFSLPSGGQVLLTTGLDGEIWSLNGHHFSREEVEEDTNSLAMLLQTHTYNTDIAVVERHDLQGKTPLKQNIKREKQKLLREYTLDVKPEERVTLIKYVAIYTGNDGPNPSSQARAMAKKAQDQGFDKLRTHHSAVWEDFWEKTDINIEGDLPAQTLLRFNLYHNNIATPAHTDHLPIGARGLSCQAYQGAAFWDQEIFNLPMFLYTRPQIARQILMYRYRTLDGARQKAHDLGYRGAFFAWISGRTGEELCPSFFFKDVLTGRPIRNHFNDWQIHISPDIVYAIWQYYKVTGDWDFVVAYGSEIIFEVARFLLSRACYRMDKKEYEIIRVLGPDEYHENVDNNAFTNYQVRFALQTALAVYSRMEDHNSCQLAELQKRLNLTQEEVELWKDMAHSLRLPQPHTESHLIEQFQGYFQLEDTTADMVATRLQDPQEYWGYPIGVAVETQVIKQADVLQLFCLHPYLFPREVLEANYTYYASRTQHGSSLSPSAYAIVASWLGKTQDAYEHFMHSCGVDLFNTGKSISGGTFIGGIHTAACGAAWKMMIFGFAGLTLREDGLSLMPNLPSQWQSISFPLCFRGSSLLCRISKTTIEINMKEEEGTALNLYVGGDTLTLTPGHTLIHRIN